VADPATELKQRVHRVVLPAWTGRHRDLGLRERESSGREYQETDVGGRVTHVCLLSMDVDDAPAGMPYRVLFTVTVAPFADPATAGQDYDRYRRVARDSRDVGGLGERAYLVSWTTPAMRYSLDEAGLFTQRGRHQVWVRLSVLRDGVWSPDELTEALVAVARPVLDGLPA